MREQEVRVRTAPFSHTTLSHNNHFNITSSLFHFQSILSVRRHCPSTHRLRLQRYPRHQHSLRPPSLPPPPVMSNPYPPQLDRKNSDPEPYAPLLGSSQYPAHGTPDAHLSQYTPDAGRAYYDHPPAGSPEDPYARDQYYEAQREGRSPFGQDDRSPYREDDRSPYGNDGRSPYEQNDPFATQESLRDTQNMYGAQRQGANDQYASPYGNRPPPPNQSQWDNDGGDIELRPMGNQKKSAASRFIPTPGPLSMKDTILFATGLDRIFRLVRIKMGESAEQVIQRRKKGLPGQRYPIVAWLLTASESR